LKRVILFCGKKDRVKEISRELKKININCAAMHSDLTQAERDDVMYRFKTSQIDVLVATDIVARGIDIDDISMVINYDVPHDSEDYVHRIGRTARADRDGIAITFVNEADISRFMSIEHFLQKDILKNPMPDGIGEGPVYIGRSGRKSTHYNRHGHGKRTGRKHHSPNDSSNKSDIKSPKHSK
jgi:superfamily II DNA/RNA helicase